MKKLTLLWIVGLLTLPCWAESPAKTDKFLEPDEAFILSTTLENRHELTARWQIAEGYYLYRSKFKFSLENLEGVLGQPQFPAGEIKKDPNFGEVEIYRHHLEVKLPLQNTKTNSIILQTTYQGCADAGLCYPPIEKSIKLRLPNNKFGTLSSIDTELSESDLIARTLEKNSTLSIMLSFFGFGLLLAFTPCVFPMIPILSSIIVGQGKNLTTYQAFLLSCTYVIAMALTYTLAGVIAGLIGENLQATFQNPWIITSFSMVFVILALSMFGFYEIQLPTHLQTKLTTLSNRQSGGTLAGVAVMGFLSALIVGPCVAAPLAGALIYIGQTGNALLGGLALFTLSIGMGIPLIVIGTSAGKLLPKAGTWMNTVKAIFGVLLLAVAITMIERIIPLQISLLLWALLLIMLAVYLGVLDRLPLYPSRWRKLSKGIGMVFLVYGTVIMVGAASGGTDVWQPLQKVGQQPPLVFKRVKNLEKLQQALNLAQEQGKTVMVDFYADWCIACKEMEHFTFGHSEVKQALADTILLQVDVTANDADDKAILQHFGLFGPPATLFFVQGQEQRAHRVVGFMPAPAFLEHLRKQQL